MVRAVGVAREAVAKVAMAVAATAVVVAVVAVEAVAVGDLYTRACDRSHKRDTCSEGSWHRGH